jgi:hypothetical protein
MKHRNSSVLVLAILLLAPALAQGAVNQWTIASVAPGPGGTISVTAEVTPGDFGPCMSYACMFIFPLAHLNVTPCPEGVTCDAGNYWGMYAVENAYTATLVLREGVQYTFAGFWDAHVMYPIFIPEPPSMVCDLPRTCGGPFEPTTFGVPPTPAQSTSWGRLKVMYR